MFIDGEDDKTLFLLVFPFFLKNIWYICIQHSQNRHRDPGTLRVIAAV